MPKSSPLERIASGQTRSTTRGLGGGVAGQGRPALSQGWTILRHGWPALILALGIVAGTVIEPPGPDGVVDQSVYGLSAEALAQGRWWTLLSHAFLPVAAWPFIFLGSMLFLFGLTPTLTANPAWMGGWRTPAVFFAAAAAGAAAHFLFGTAAFYSEPWAAAGGLFFYHFWSGRFRSMFANGGVDVAESRKESHERDFRIARNYWINACITLQAGYLLFDDFALLSVIGSFEALTLFWALALLGFLALHGLERHGGVVGLWIARIAGHLAIAAALGVWLWQLALWVIDSQAMLLGLPWASYLAGAAVGLLAGLFERRRLRAH